MKPWKIDALRAFGMFLVSVVSGLGVYQTGPESLAQFGDWIWQPSMQGLVVGLGSLGIYRVGNGHSAAK